MTITPSRAYCRPENAEQLLGGWAHPARPQPDFDWSDQDAVEPGFFHKSGLDNYGFKLWLRLAESIPAVGDFAGIEATTAGFYAMTPDHNPWFGFDPRRPNLLHAVGFSGHGAMLGPFTAAAISAMAMAGHDLREIELDGRPVDLSALLLGRRHREPEGMVI
jgi:glycine/D-amino acid oxidase-like deaminating enzyme